ncbi:MAG TPA: nuclear transport factor 2 family protein [Gaiellaceae bacterium]|nr:nuclear transport factor 2 family protein [Gaiellaceae bacterium]
MTGETVRLFWERLPSRDWEGVAELLHPDVVVDWPNTAERMRGRDNYLAVVRAFGEGWRVHVLRVVDGGDTVVSEVRVERENERYVAVSFFELDEGRIDRAVEYWSDDEPEPPAEWRAPWTESL